MDWWKRLFNNKPQEEEDVTDLITIMPDDVDPPPLVVPNEPISTHISAQVLQDVWPQAIDRASGMQERLKQEFKKRGYALSIIGDAISLYIPDTELFEQALSHQDVVTTALRQVLGRTLHFEITDTLTVSFEIEDDILPPPPPKPNLIDRIAQQFCQQSELFSLYKPQEGSIDVLPTDIAGVELHWFRVRENRPMNRVTAFLEAFCISVVTSMPPVLPSAALNVARSAVEDRLDIQQPLTPHLMEALAQRILTHLAQQPSEVATNTFFLFVANFPQNGIHELTRPFDLAAPRATPIPFAVSKLQRTDAGMPSRKLFLDTLTNWRERTNRYGRLNPVIGDDYYRHDLTATRIQECIRQGQNFGVFGLRRMGKTSLLQEMQRTEAFGPACVSFINMQAYLGRSVWAVLRDAIMNWKESLAPLLSEEQRVELALIDPAKAFEPLNLDVFEQSIQSLLRLLPEEKRLVLILDEAGELLPDPPDYQKELFPHWRDFLGFLRGRHYASMLPSNSEYRFVLGVATYKNDIVYEILGHTNHNPLWKQIYEIWLGPLGREDCDRMVQDIGAMVGLYFPPDVLQLLYEQTYGHPQITRELCNELVKNAPQLPYQIQIEEIRTALTRYIEDGRTLPEMFKSLELIEKAVVEYLAHHNKCFITDMRETLQTIVKDQKYYAEISVTNMQETLQAIIKDQEEKGGSGIADMQRILSSLRTFKGRLNRMSQFGLIGIDTHTQTITLTFKLFHSFFNTNREKEESK